MSGTGPSSKPEFPPLLPVGFHPMSLDDLRQLCVDGFPLSGTRAAIMDGLEQVVGILRADQLAGELWIDGSFLTEKINPQDVDLALKLDDSFLAQCSQGQLDRINWFNDSPDLEGTYFCDSYVFAVYPEGHALHGQGDWMNAYWIRQYGFNRDDTQYKGIARIDLQ